MTKKRIGDVLIEHGIISKEALEDALKEKQANELVGETLLRLGLVTENQILTSLSKSTGVERIVLSKVNITSDATKLVNEAFCRKNSIIPVEISKKSLIFAIDNPLNFTAIEELRFVTGLRPRARIAPKSDILAQIDKHYGFSRMLDELGVVVEKDEEDKVSLTLDDDTPMVKLVNQIISSAITAGASDIHLDPEDDQLNIRYRVDGTLETVKTFPIEIQRQMISRVKVMANMDITETRRPQDGRIINEHRDKIIDLRVSTLPTVKGEKIVLRLLDLSIYVQDISKLGLSSSDEEKIKKMIQQPNGIILVSGPTGSGKTTTLYACLNELNNDEVNIVTVEDPVEIKTRGINQVQVNRDVDVTFANALRSVLRQDPDIIMIGEIRDYETAEIAVRSSLTGHLVLSSIHTNDSVKTITRLLDMDVQPYLLASSINGIIAQRLVRKLCPECREKVIPNELEKNLLEKHGRNSEYIYHAKGCPACANKGYVGRTAIYEILEMDDNVRTMISNKSSMLEIKNYMKSIGMISILESGLDKVISGITTLDEVLNVAVE